MVSLHRHQNIVTIPIFYGRRTTFSVFCLFLFCLRLRNLNSEYVLFMTLLWFFSSISLLNFLLLKLAYCSKNWPFSNCFVSFNITGWTTVDKEFLVLSYRNVDTMGLFCSPYQNSMDFFLTLFLLFFPCKFFNSLTV